MIFKMFRATEIFLHFSAFCFSYFGTNLENFYEKILLILIFLIESLNVFKGRIHLKPGSPRMPMSPI